MKRLLVLSLMCLPAMAMATVTPNHISSKRIDAIAADALERFGVPGLAIAVVQPGAAPHIRGYGLQTFDQEKAVTDNTLFGIGSISKAFTSTGLAQLVEAGKLNWDDRVVDHIPEFRMADAWVTREFQVRDLLTHRSGLAPYAGDLVILTEGKANKAQVYQALANLPAASSFRTEFAYDNLLYVVAGDLIERLSGMSWREYINSKLLSPLAMDDCVASFDQLPRRAIVASAHEFADGQFQVVNFPLPPVVDAAGGIYCNAQGMAQWLKFNLGLLQIGNAVLNSSGVAELHKPVTPMAVRGDAKRYGGSSFAAYGLGWFLQDSYGTLQAHHRGGLPGMVSYISLFPEAGLGAMVMTNRGSRAAVAVIQQLAEDAFAAEPRDIISERALSHTATSVPPEEINTAFAKPFSRPALPLPQYAGNYRDAWFGEVTVELKNQRLSLNMGSAYLTATLEHVTADRFIARWANRALNADAYVNFMIDAYGEISSVSLRAVSAHTDPSFNFHDLKLIRVQK